jgi:hypothetical protein
VLPKIDMIPSNSDIHAVWRQGATLAIRRISCQPNDPRFSVYMFGRKSEWAMRFQQHTYVSAEEARELLALPRIVWVDSTHKP